MRLFKYFSESGLLRFLSEFTVRFSPPYVFNDPFEGRPRLGLDGEWTRLAQEERSGKRGKLQIASRIAQLKIDANEGFGPRMAPDTAIGDRLGMLCLSEDPLNMLMWGHYADGHKGGVVEFDASHPFFRHRQLRSGFFNMLRKVEYSKSRPNLSMEFFRRHQAGSLYLEGWRALVTGPHPIFFTKSLNWAYEREWRLIRQLRDEASFLPDAGVATRHHEARLDESQLAKIPPAAVRSITLGSMSRRYRDTDSDGLEEEVWELLDRNPGAAHVRVRKARLHEDEYRLVSYSLQNEREIRLNTSRGEQTMRRHGFVGRQAVATRGKAEKR